MVKCAVIVVAAGRGHRFGKGLPKQYQLLNNQPVLTHCLKTFCAHPAISAVRVIIHKDDEALYNEAVKDLPVLAPVFGGKERQDSVRIGLKSLEDIQPDIVLIHDGARPFVDNDTINRIIETAVDKGAIPALAVVDTLKKSNENRQIVNTVDRNGLWRVQTPQGFPFQTILKAHEQLAGQSLTDDASVAEFVGLPVVLLDGNENNFKITSFDDLKRAEKLIMNNKTDIRTGIGFDVHAFEKGDGIWLCGLFVPYTKKLAGHSDADVALHALTDALLGTCGAGDIGLRFPPSDMQWKGKESSFFVKDAVRLIAEKGGTILNVDITIIGEEPKIGPYRTEMVSKLSEMMNLSPDRINVKGTTTEHLGFTGRKEGLASQAVASVLF